MAEPFTFRVPATTAHLGPGYGVVGLALDLTMRVTVEPRRKGTGIEVLRLGTIVDPADDPRHDPVQRGIHRAAERLQVKLPPSMEVTVESDVPLACGLGTTSGAYAAGLALAARLAKGPPDFDDLASMLVELGGDPGHGAASLTGGLVACTPVAVGEGRTAYRVFPHSVLDTWRVVVVVPRVTVGVFEAQRALPATVPHAAVARTTGRTVGLLRALSLGDEELLGQCIVDEVHVPYRRRSTPGLDEALRAATDAGAAGATISGAGPSAIAFTTDATRCDAIGEAMAAAFAARGVESRTLVTQPTERGALDDE